MQELSPTQRALTVLEKNSDPKVREIGKYLTRTFDRRDKILLLVKESLGQIRLDMKYLVFDLEATRRERDKLKELP